MFFLFSPISSLALWCRLVCMMYVLSSFVCEHTETRFFIGSPSVVTKQGTRGLNRWLCTGSGHNIRICNLIARDINIWGCFYFRLERAEACPGREQRAAIVKTSFYNSRVLFNLIKYRCRLLLVSALSGGLVNGEGHGARTVAVA